LIKNLLFLNFYFWEILQNKIHNNALGSTRMVGTARITTTIKVLKVFKKQQSTKKFCHFILGQTGYLIKQ